MPPKPPRDIDTLAVLAAQAGPDPVAWLINSLTVETVQYQRRWQAGLVAILARGEDPQSAYNEAFTHYSTSLRLLIAMVSALQPTLSAERAAAHALELTRASDVNHVSLDPPGAALLPPPEQSAATFARVIRVLAGQVARDTASGTFAQAAVATRLFYIVARLVMTRGSGGVSENEVNAVASALLSEAAQTPGQTRV